MWLVAALLSLLFVGLEVQSRTTPAEVEAIRVADFVNYTHIAIELSQSSGEVEFLASSVGDYSLLIVKLHDTAPGVLTSEYAVESDVL
ncbi:MAG: hypothetical protein ACP5I1_09010, partial [Candidatus Hinthialibacter sp.]